jgi:hypothetical protein
MKENMKIAIHQIETNSTDILYIEKYWPLARRIKTTKLIKTTSFFLSVGVSTDRKSLTGAGLWPVSSRY